MAPGDHVKVQFERFGVRFWHHGIDVGNRCIVSISPEGVLMQSLAVFSEGRPVFKVVYKPGKVPFTLADIARRATRSHTNQRVGGPGSEPHVDYSLTMWNCEHFAVYCCTGVRLSRQVADKGRTIILGGVAVALFSPVGVAGLVLATFGGVLLGSGGLRELMRGTTTYVP